MRTPSRRVLASAAAAATIVAVGAAATIWALRGSPRTIGASELRAYPPIVFVAGAAHRVSYSASGDLYSARPDAARARRLRAWRSLRGPGPTAADGEPYGTYTARWSPDGRRIALVLSVWYGDPFAELAVVSSDGRRLRKLTAAGTLMTDVSWTPQGALVVSDQNGPVLAVSMNRRSRQLGSGSDPDLAPAGWEPRGGDTPRARSVRAAQHYCSPTHPAR